MLPTRSLYESQALTKKPRAPPLPTLAGIVCYVVYRPTRFADIDSPSRRRTKIHFLTFLAMVRFQPFTPSITKTHQTIANKKNNNQWKADRQANAITVWRTQNVPRGYNIPFPLNNPRHDNPPPPHSPPHKNVEHQHTNG